MLQYKYIQQVNMKELDMFIKSFKHTTLSLMHQIWSKLQPQVNKIRQKSKMCKFLIEFVHSHLLDEDEKCKIPKLSQTYWLQLIHIELK